MSKVLEYFRTDWAAMTQHDWVGLLTTMGVFIALLIVYVYVLHPKNRERLEARRHLPDDGEFDSEERR